ncbi:hypothetical protein BPLS_P5061 [Bathymodiolus platifrons methanotrophic gill symbiont]|uniref:hypothetical protein n=1 Tax=Bathymodiolus platifrons methanotrophic gill symbiont TaxID=113268 RepID=UPI001B444BE1|nr:hypothetical protein [Bathymodiolus platifrons methanotrophic gill symbiont]GFO76951.1 hypothetical protein BPLS_P5061 [Bathymodiolus platifrons methanotrophic gill symbiont]
MQESVSYFQAVVSGINHSYTTFIKGKKPKYLKMLGFFFAFKPYTLKVRGLFLNLKEEISGYIANNFNSYNQDIASLAVVKTSNKPFSHFFLARHPPNFMKHLGRPVISVH